MECLILGPPHASVTVLLMIVTCSYVDQFYTFIMTLLELTKTGKHFLKSVKVT